MRAFFNIRNIKTNHKIQLVFGALLLWSCFSILKSIQVYPVIIFPHFAGKKQGNDPVVLTPKVFSSKTGNEVDIIELLKPYDKRFILFTKANLCDEQNSKSTIELLEKIHLEKTGIKDSFYVHVKQAITSN